MTKQLYGQSCIGHPNVTRTTTNYQSPGSRRRSKMNYRRPYVCAKVMLFAVWGILFLMATRTATRTIYLSKPTLSFYVLAFTVKTRTYSPNRMYIPSHLRYTSSGLYRSQRCSIPNGPNNRHPCTDAMVLPERPTHMIPTTTMMYSLPMDLLEHMHSLPVLALPTVSHVMHTTSSFLAITKADIGSFLPFSELGRELSQSLDIGSNLSRNVGNLPETTTGLVLESLGYDLLVFLAASVFVTPICRSINTTPILGYLIIGALLGPHGLDVFANSKADVELGDFGILFLLFSEGLEVTTPRLRKLANFLPLGLAQISLVTGVITFAFLTGFPQMLAHYLPLDQALIDINRPAEAVVLAFAGALSTSAFIFPVLKERGWEEEESGEAATSILLLQDLLVAPLLVLLPFVVGDTSTDYTAFGYLTAKATLGFGAIMYFASFILRRIFMVVANTQSAETFVALCLLVAAGMGTIAKFFGLTDTAGAFAAGVLLANTNYRSQIQADILPFKGILLGIFFMDAGSTFDSELVLAEWPTILVGAASLLVLKAVTLGAATRVPRWMEPNRLSMADGLRVALLLSGGGEFAFVVLALANKLSLIPQELSAILTAIILITMGLTPLLGQLAAALSEPLVGMVDRGPNSIDVSVNGLNGSNENSFPSVVSSDAIVVCGYGEIGRSLVQVLNSEMCLQLRSSKAHVSEHETVVSVVAFDSDPVLVNSNVKPGPSSIVIFGDGANAEVIRSSGIRDPTAIFICYEDHSRTLSATSRLRASFSDTPIFVRAATRADILPLTAAGATEVVVEADELPRAAPSLIRGAWKGNLDRQYILNEEKVREAAASAAGVTFPEVDQLLQLFAGMDQDMSGFVTVSELERVLERSTNWIATDDEIAQFDHWIETTLRDLDPLDAIEFCRLYGRAPDYIRKAFGITK